MDAVFDDFAVDAVKTGLLASVDVVEAVARRLRAADVGGVVVDPVVCAASGDVFVDDATTEAIKAELLPLATVITPNAAEAQLLGGEAVEGTLGGPRAGAAARLLEHGPRAVVVKGARLGETRPRRWRGSGRRGLRATTSSSTCAPSRTAPSRPSRVPPGVRLDLRAPQMISAQAPPSPRGTRTARAAPSSAAVAARLGRRRRGRRSKGRGCPFGRGAARVRVFEHWARRARAAHHGRHARGPA